MENEKREFLRGFAAGLRTAIDMLESDMTDGNGNVDWQCCFDTWCLSIAADEMEREAGRLGSDAQRERDRFCRDAIAIVGEVWAGWLNSLEFAAR